MNQANVFAKMIKKTGIYSDSDMKTYLTISLEEMKEYLKTIDKETLLSSSHKKTLSSFLDLFTASFAIKSIIEGNVELSQSLVTCLCPLFNHTYEEKIFSGFWKILHKYMNVNSRILTFEHVHPILSLVFRERKPYVYDCLEFIITSLQKDKGDISFWWFCFVKAIMPYFINYPISDSTPFQKEKKSINGIVALRLSSFFIFFLSNLQFSQFYTPLDPDYHMCIYYYIQKLVHNNDGSYAPVLSKLSSLLFPFIIHIPTVPTNILSENMISIMPHHEELLYLSLKQIRENSFDLIGSSLQLLLINIIHENSSCHSVLLFKAYISFYMSFLSQANDPILIGGVFTFINAKFKSDQITRLFIETLLSMTPPSTDVWHFVVGYFLSNVQFCRVFNDYIEYFLLSIGDIVFGYESNGEVRKLYKYPQDYISFVIDYSSWGLDDVASCLKVLSSIGSDSLFCLISQTLLRLKNYYSVGTGNSLSNLCSVLLNNTKLSFDVNKVLCITKLFPNWRSIPSDKQIYWVNFFTDNRILCEQSLLDSVLGLFISPQFFDSIQLFSRSLVSLVTKGKMKFESTLKISFLHSLLIFINSSKISSDLDPCIIITLINTVFPQVLSQDEWIEISFSILFNEICDKSTERFSLESVRFFGDVIESSDTPNQILSLSSIISMKSILIEKDPTLLPLLLERLFHKCSSSVNRVDRFVAYLLVISDIVQATRDQINLFWSFTDGFIKNPSKTIRLLVHLFRRVIIESFGCIDECNNKNINISAEFMNNGFSEKPIIHEFKFEHLIGQSSICISQHCQCQDSCKNENPCHVIIPQETDDPEENHLHCQLLESICNFQGIDKYDSSDVEPLSLPDDSISSDVVIDDPIQPEECIQSNMVQRSLNASLQEMYSTSTEEESLLINGKIIQRYNAYFYVPNYDDFLYFDSFFSMIGSIENDTVLYSNYRMETRFQYIKEINNLKSKVFYVWSEDDAISLPNNLPCIVMYASHYPMIYVVPYHLDHLVSKGLISIPIVTNAITLVSMLRFNPSLIEDPINESSILEQIVSSYVPDNEITK